MEKDERWLTSKEVCEYLSIRRETLIFWIETMQFPAVKLMTADFPNVIRIGAYAFYDCVSLSELVLTIV